MDRIIVDESFTSQLPNVEAPCLVFDSTGKKIGCFTPEVAASLYEAAGPTVSEEELARRERVGGGRSLAEILNDVQQKQ
jgi:hypothetical protein